MFILGKQPLVTLSPFDIKQRLSKRKFKTFYLLGIYFLFTATTGISQVGIGITTPDNSAMLQVQSTEKGFLLPQMSSAQRTSIATPANGLQVYDTNTNSIWYFNGTFWVNTQAMATEGDIKSGIQTADHSGWVLLDGRPLTALSANQQAVAASLGLTGNLPDASNAYLSQNGGAMGAVSGTNTTTLTQANLPNVNFTGTAASAGGHNHSVDPAAVTSSSDGNHAHVTDPAAIVTTTNGNHSHAIGRRSNPDAGAYDAGDGRRFENSAATTDRGYLGTFSTGGDGNHNHTVDIPATTSTMAGAHSHTIDVPSTTSTTNGAHTHTVTVPSGGADAPLNIAPQTLSVNMFIYLGL